MNFKSIFFLLNLTWKDRWYTCSDKRMMREDEYWCYKNTGVKNCGAIINSYSFLGALQIARSFQHIKKSFLITCP